MKEIYLNEPSIFEKLWGWMPIILALVIGLVIGVEFTSIHALFYLDEHKVEFCKKVMEGKK